MTAELSFSPVDYKHEHLPHLLDFLRECLPQSGRALDIDGRHSFYKDIEGCFEGFWCMFDDSRIIGAVGLKRLDAEKCELKSLYLLERYHGMGYGKLLLHKAIEHAAAAGFRRMYLDTLSTSTRAIALYRRAGFTDIEKYNNSERSDVFMVLDLRNR